MYRFRPKSEPSPSPPGTDPAGGARSRPNQLSRASPPQESSPPSYRSVGLVDRAIDAPGRPPGSPAVELRPSHSRGIHGGRSTLGGLHGLSLLGLSAREARLYFAFLDGPRSAREAAEIAGLHRATGYRVLLRLLDRGLIASHGLTPRRFQAIDPGILFRRLELFYRDETEIPGLLAEAFGAEGEPRPNGLPSGVGVTEPPRILAPEGRSPHPAILELARAKRAVAAVVRPQSTPVSYRTALARTLGQLVRSGIHVRLITDAMPADYRFCRAVVREAGGSAATIQIRHFSPVATQLYSVDRQTVVRIPTLGASSRSAPVGVALDDRARVQSLVTRFESLWSEATGPAPALRPHPDSARTSARYEYRVASSS